MKLVSFNVNGVRVRIHQLAAVAERHQPDIIALQETKVEDDLFPTDELAALGFPHLVAHGQKGHYGVALLSRHSLSEVQLGIPWRDESQQRRFVSAAFELDGHRFRIINGYFPNGENRAHPTKFPHKAEFYQDVLRYLGERCEPGENLILAGDMNVAPDDADIGIGADNAKRWLRSGKASFLPEERQWLTALLDWGLTDAFQQPEADNERRFSWFDYRSRGFERGPKRGLRIDLILASASLIARLADSGIDYQVRGLQRPSDHCPVWSQFRL